MTAMLKRTCLLFCAGAASIALLQGTRVDTTKERDARMAWWREARFGMFVHWGLYSGLAGTWDGKPVHGEL